MRSASMPDLQRADIDSVTQSADAVTLNVSRVRGYGVRRHGTITFQGVTSFAGYDERGGALVPLKAGVTITAWQWNEQEVAFSTQIYTGPGETQDVQYRLVFAQVRCQLRLSIGATLGYWLDR